MNGNNRNFEKDLAIFCSESVSKQPTQLIVELNSSLQQKLGTMDVIFSHLQLIVDVQPILTPKSRNFQYCQNQLSLPRHLKTHITFSMFPKLGTNLSFLKKTYSQLTICSMLCTEQYNIYYIFRQIYQFGSCLESDATKKLQFFSAQLAYKKQNQEKPAK